MRFTPEILQKHTQILVDKITKKGRSIVAAYLRGSLLYGSPLIGGAGDIDLVFIHNAPPEKPREIIKLTPEIHFDIEHHESTLYGKPREIRLDPWLGPALRDAQPLYDPRHFLDYTQAGTRSNFDFPENIQARAKPLLEDARAFWLERQISTPQDIITEFPAFLTALNKALNSVALLSGPPLTTRTLGRDFHLRAADAGAPSLGSAFKHLLGAVTVTETQLVDWLLSWNKQMDRIGELSDPLPILVQKRLYFQQAMDSFLAKKNILAGLWPLLTTWAEAFNYLPSQEQIQPDWIKTLTALGFAGSDYQQRLAAFDSFLELCESLVLGEVSE